MDAGVAVYNLPAGWSCAATSDGRFFFVEYVISLSSNTVQGSLEHYRTGVP